MQTGSKACSSMYVMATLKLGICLVWVWGAPGRLCAVFITGHARGGAGKTRVDWPRGGHT